MALETGGSPQQNIVSPDQYTIEREKDLTATTIDWTAAAQDITDVANKIRDDRQKTKDQLYANTRTAINEVNAEIPVDNQSLGALVIDGSAQTAEAIALSNKRMLNGEIKPQDHQRFVQNTKDNWAAYSQSIKKWDKSYNESMTRVENGTASEREIWAHEQIQSFGNVNGLKQIVNPLDGSLTLVRPNEDGSLPDRVKNPGAYMPVAYLNNILQQREDRTDLSATVAPMADRLATVIQTEINDANGAYKSYEDFRNMKDADKIITNEALSVTTNQGASTSILAQNIDPKTKKRYEFTQSKDEAKTSSHFILQTQSPNGLFESELTEDQERHALELTKEKIYSQLDSKMKYDKGARFDPTRKSAQDYGKERNKIAGYMGNANRLQTSNDEEFELVVRDVVADVNAQAKEGDNRIVNIERTADEFIVEIIDDRGRRSKEPIPRKKDDKNLSMQDISQGLIRYIAPSSQIEDQSFDAMVDIYNEVSGGFTGEASDVSASAGVGFQEVPTISYRPEETQAFTDLKNTQDIDAVGIAAGDLLNSKLRRLGMQGSVNIDPDLSGGDGEITINIDGVGEETIRYDGENANVLQLVKDYVEKARIAHNAEGGVKKSDKPKVDAFGKPI